MTQSTLGNKRYIPELDGLRGIAALAVFFHHLCFTSIQPDGWNPFVRVLFSASEYGLYGVELFFVLSGFLITSLLLQDRSSENFYHNFYWKRALRILPLYLISLSAVWLLIQNSTGGVILGALFLANFASIFHVQLGGPYWTLAIEEQFYLIWPRFVRKLPTQQVKALSIGIIIVEPILRLIATFFHHHDFIFTFFHCDGLAFGALLASQSFSDRKSFQDAPTRNTWANSSLWIIISALICVLSESKLVASSYPTQGTALLLSSICFLFYGIIRIAIEYSGSKYLALLRSPVLVFFGLISYCMYMSHAFVMQLYDYWHGPMQTGDMVAYGSRLGIVFGFTVALCLVSRYALELPFMSLRKIVLRPESLENS